MVNITFFAQKTAFTFLRLIIYSFGIRAIRYFYAEEIGCEGTHQLRICEVLANLVEISRLKTHANIHSLYAANNPAFGLLVAFVFQREVRILEVSVQDILHLT